MPPSVSHLHKLVARNYKLFRAAWTKASHLLQSQPFTIRFINGKLQPILVEAVAQQPLHPAARLRQRVADQSRHYTTSTLKFDRSTFPKSRTGDAVRRLTGQTPFAHQLRPNITGGTLSRSAGGYSLGSGRVGGVRYFSHSPAAPAEVIQNVSQAVRAFCLGGHKAQYNGTTSRGEKRYRAMSTLQDQTTRKMNAVPKATPGSFIDFAVNPTITALTPLSTIAGFTDSDFGNAKPSLNSQGLLDVLSADFSRALKDLAAVLNDLQRLSALGDLPISYRAPGTLRVHFPGCDPESVEAICQELEIKRGLVGQDDDFEIFAGTAIALLFPFAPSKPASAQSVLSRGHDPAPLNWKGMMSEADEQYSTQSEDSSDLFEVAHGKTSQQPSNWSPEGYESLRSPSHGFDSLPSDPLEYQDFEGIYRFIEMCDTAQR